MSAAATETTLPIRFTLAEVGAFREQFESSSAYELLQWGLRRFGSGLVLASSFSAEDVVLIDLATRIDPHVRVFTLDTGRLHQETYDTLERVREFFGISVEVLFPDRAAVEDLVLSKGPNSFYTSSQCRKECCEIRKVEPLRRHLSDADAWATGLRRSQSVTRERLAKVEFDLRNGGILKLNPLADWDSCDVWAHVREHGLPYNPLHDRGFPSIGCAPCTRAVKAGEDEREGRWWWEKPDEKECGLHK